MLGQGSTGGELFAAADARGHAADDGATLHGDDRVPGIAGLEPSAANALEKNDLHTLLAQRLDQSVVLALHVGNRRDAVALPVPARLRVAEGADGFDALGGIDDLQFIAGTMHQNDAKLPHVVVAAPGPPPNPL
jgi:hypothetical protein